MTNMEDNTLFEEAWYALETNDNSALVELAYEPYVETTVVYNAAM